MKAEAFEDQSGPIAERLAAGLARVGLALRHDAWHRAHLQGLSPTQAQILVRLGTLGPLPLGRLAAEIGVGPPTASEALGPLVTKGLVRKVSAKDDARTLHISLTATGRRLARRLADWPDFLREVLEELSPEDQEALLRAVSLVILALQRRGRIPVARMCVTCRFFRPNVHDDPERPHHCAFVDAPFGDRALRIDCPDHRPAVWRLPGPAGASERVLWDPGRCAGRQR